MPANQNQRPKFYEDQYLGAADLTAAVDYGRLQNARHALGAHTWGIAAGLQLKEAAQAGGGVSVHLLPGYAWDGYGRPVIVLAPYRIAEEKFSAIKFDPMIDTPGGKGRLIPVWLSYDEKATQRPRAGFELCDAADQFSRIQESFRIEIGERPNVTDRYSGVTVGAKRLTDAKTALRTFDPAAPLVWDESISQQTFPEGQDQARWLIPIGYVRWLPVQNQPGHFVARDDSGMGGLPKDSDQIRVFRRHIGVVTEGIEAADGRIRLKNRGNNFSPVRSDDLVWIEGDVRIEGDLRLFDHKLDFKDSSGSENGIPISISRVDGPGKGSLRAVIGKASAGANTFAVGPLDGANNFKAKLTVRDDGNVGIGTEAPGFKLDVADRMRVRQGSSPSAGIWFFQNAPNADRAFVGMALDDRVGFWGHSGAQWGLVMDTTSGNVGIGTIAPTHKFHVLAGEAVGLFESTGSQAYLRLYTKEGQNNRVEITNRPGGRLSLWTGGAGDAFNVTRDGSIGIGTVAPTHKFHVLAGEAVGLFESTGSQAFLRFVTNEGMNNRVEITNRPGGRLSLWTADGGDALNVTKGGNVGIGTTTPSERLHVAGNAAVTGKVWADSFFTTSDRRLKKGIRPLTGALQKLLELRGVNFDWKESDEMKDLGGPQIGLVAQEVEKVFPDWVAVAPNGYKAIGFRGFEALVIEALREINKQVEKLNRRIDKLEKARAAEPGRKKRPAKEK